MFTNSGNTKRVRLSPNCHNQPVVLHLEIINFARSSLAHDRLAIDSIGLGIDFGGNGCKIPLQSHIMSHPDVLDVGGTFMVEAVLRST
jgi:hypothetical protein